MQNLASRDQSRLSEPIKELDILLTQVLFMSQLIILNWLLFSPLIESSFLIFLLCSDCCRFAFGYHARAWWPSKLLITSTGLFDVLACIHTSYFICHIWFVSDIHFSDSPCIDAFSLDHQLITHLDLVLILIPLSLKISGNMRIEFYSRYSFYLFVLIAWYGDSALFRFLGTSGQNVDDLEKYSEAKDKLEFMERTLRWRHLAPTAPNTLGKSSCCFSPC